MIHQILSCSNDLCGKDLFPTCLWSRTIPKNPFVMETKRGWHQVDEGAIKGEKKKWWWLTTLADCIQFKNNPRVILIFISEPRTGPLGCFKCFKWNQSWTPGALRQRGERVSNKRPKTFVALSFLPLSVSLSLKHPHNHLNHTIPFSFNKTNSPDTLFLHVITPFSFTPYIFLSSPWCPSSSLHFPSLINVICEEHTNINTHAGTN